jgi:hypothetical protein
MPILPNPLPWYLPMFLPGPAVGSATFIAEDLIRLDLSAQARVDSEYLDVNNYSIALRSDTPKPGDEVRVLEVLPPTDANVVTTQYVYLLTTRHTLGAYYAVTLSGALVDSAGTQVYLPPASYAARVTKTMQVLKSIPSHFDTRNTSILRNLLTAISLQDDQIGGSRKDEFL